MSKYKHNILYISHYPHYQMGGQRSMLALIDNLDRNKYIVHCLCPAGGELTPKLKEMGVKVLNLDLSSLKPKHYPLIIKNLYYLVKYIKANKIDIVHPDSPRDTLLAGLAKYFCKFKLVWHVRLTSNNNLDKLCYKYSDKVIGISEGVIPRFAEFDLSKYMTIFNGVDCKIFKPNDDKPAIRKLLKLAESYFIVIFVGQIKIGKGIFDLVKAMGLLQDKPIKLYIIGTYIDNIIEEELKAEISNLKNIEVLAQQNNIYDFMAASDILVLPSYEGVEGMGRVLFEAMACGTPVIGTNISGIREAIDSQTGILVNEKSPEQIKEAILKFYDNPDLWSKFSKAGIIRANEIFSIEKHADSVMQVYDKLLSN